MSMSDKVTIEDILKEKPKSIVLQARTLVQLSDLNGSVADVIKDIEDLKKNNRDEHKSIVELIAENKKETKEELKDCIKGKWFKIVAVIGTALLILFNIWDRVQQYYIGG